MSFPIVATVYQALAELQNQENTLGRPEGPFPETLPGNLIKQRPDIFQPRCKRLDKLHVEELSKIIERRTTLDPVLVYPLGDEFLLIDGHHRMAAYKKARCFDEIPIEVFSGSLKEAVLASGLLNGRTRLAMTKTERMDYAWRLVRMKAYSKAQVCEAASVSDGQVAKMRRVLKRLGEDADQFESWHRARRSDQESSFEPMSEDEHEAMIERKAQKLADKMLKAFGNKLASNPEVTALALEIHLGRKATEIAIELRHLLDRDEWDEEDDEDDF